MLKRSMVGLIAAVLLMSLSVLTACSRSSEPMSIAPSTTTPETITTPKTPAAITPVVWSPDMDCAACHIMKSYVASLQDSNLGAYVHAQKGFVCLDCHEQEAVEEVHGSANGSATSIVEREFSTELCLGCHGAMEISLHPRRIAVHLGRDQAARGKS